MDNTFGEKSRQNFRIEIENKNTIIKEITDFDLEQTLECGQCFRFYKQDEEDYVVVAFNKLLHIKQSGNQLIFFNTEKPDVENIWIPYFDLERDYNEIKSFLLKKDSKLEEAIKEKWGIRILNQEKNNISHRLLLLNTHRIPQLFF